MMLPAAIVLATIALQPPASPPATEKKPEPPAATGEAKPKASAVVFPHPLITEVLYAVPGGPAGDASGDGNRDNAGDEFVELVNPHDKPIQLNGYAISGKSAPPDAKTFTQVKFTFPPLELKPGEVVVVFNGNKQTWTGPVGDTSRAPEGGNDKFRGARVFTMGNTKEKVGFVNRADYVLLTAPDGTKVDCIKWGDAHPPADCRVVEEAPLISGQSIARRTITSPMEAHPMVDEKSYSPGRFPYTSEEPKPAEKPAPPASPSSPSPKP